MINMTTPLPILSWMQALSDPTRTRLLRLLERYELTVAELCSIMQLPQSTTSRHLKVLTDEKWLTSRRDGTSRLYRMILDDLEPAARQLWLLIREQTAKTKIAEQDEQRLSVVLVERQTKSREFFESSAGQWDKLRGELFGERFDLNGLLGLLDENWVVGDLGCGTGQVAETLSHFVKHVIAVDSSQAMLTGAKQRMGAVENVELRQGDLQALPIDDGRLDAAVSMLVLHHLPEPERVVEEMYRVLGEGGRVLVVDMQPHDRREYQQQMGHVWLGFGEGRMKQLFEGAGFERVRYTMLPGGSEAKGPGLFAASALKR